MTDPIQPTPSPTRLSLVRSPETATGDDPAIAALAELARVRERCSIADKMYADAQDASPRECRLDELENKWNEMLEKESKAEGEVFKTAPATPAGALMLLRAIAGHID